MGSNLELCSPTLLSPSTPPPQSPHFLLHFRAPAPAILWPFTLSLGHPIHLFFIKLQRSPRLISCGSWWNGEHAGSFPETGRGRERCQRSGGCRGGFGAVRRKMERPRFVGPPHSHGVISLN